MIYWACKRKPPIQIVHSEVGIDMDSKIPEIIIFLTFLSEKDVSLDRLIQLSLSDKITKKIKLVIDFNPYFYLGSERCQLPPSMSHPSPQTLTHPVE
jgi:hypothetical protein